MDVLRQAREDRVAAQHRDAPRLRGDATRRAKSIACREPVASVAPRNVGPSKSLFTQGTPEQSN